MITVVRVAKVLLLLLLAWLTVMLVIALGSSTTGAIEKVVLVILIAGCVFVAAKISALAAKASTRLRRP